MATGDAEQKASPALGGSPSPSAPSPPIPPPRPPSTAWRGEGLLAVSVDLDELDLYRAIHGLPSSGEAARVAYEVGVPRALGFAESLGVPLTFFAVGADLAHQACADVLTSARRAGHEIASHSLTHPYNLVRLSAAEIRREVEGSFEAIERAVGARPAGFRAPGYTISDAVFDVLEQARARYDSSVFPCPLYYGAKLAVLGSMQALGKRSASIVGPPHVLAAPAEPYRLARPYWKRGDRPLVELPIQVTRGPRLPVIGTTLGRAGERGARALVRACGDTPLLNIELHAIDFLDRADVPVELTGLPELRAPLTRRLSALRAAVGAALASGRRAVTLAAAAALAS